MQDLDTLSLNKAAAHPFGTFYLVLFSSLFKCDCSVCEITMHYAVWYRKNRISVLLYSIFYFGSKNFNETNKLFIPALETVFTPAHILALSMICYLVRSEAVYTMCLEY